MRECSPGPAASRYAVVALTPSTSRNSSAESGPVIAPGTQVRPPSTVRDQVAWCPETHTTLSSTALTACRSAVVWLCCSVMVPSTTGRSPVCGRLWRAHPATSTTNKRRSLMAARYHGSLRPLWRYGREMNLPVVVRPNGWRLSCAAVQWFSQMQFYYDGRRQLQPRVRQPDR